MTDKTTIPLVSVVMAAYNGEKFIAEQLRSILNQDYCNLEIIVVDDCSRDSTAAIVEEIAARSLTIQLFRANENRGVVATFEKALSLAKGEYIVISDQDDIFDGDKISTLYHALRENENADIALSDLRLIDESGRVTAPSMWKYQKIKPVRGKPFRRLVYMNSVTGCAMMIRKKLLDLAMPFPKDCNMHDWWLAVVATSEKGGGIVSVDRPLVSYRQHSSNVIGAQSAAITGLLRQATVLDEKIKLNEMHLRRVKGYLERGNLWSANDLLILQRAREMYEGYIEGYRVNGLRGLYLRAACLPDRLFFASTRSFFHMLSVLFFVIFPRSVDLLHRTIRQGSKN